MSEMRKKQTLKKMGKMIANKWVSVFNSKGFVIISCKLLTEKTIDEDDRCTYQEVNNEVAHRKIIEDFVKEINIDQPD
jgi:hypothetical protein